MPDRTPRPFPAVRRVAGFTLIELMVVMVLIGIIFSFAMLSMRGDDAAVLLKQESERFKALITLASDEAVLRGEEVALRFRDDGYEFLVLDETGWKPADDGVLKSYDLPAEIELRLDVGEELPKFPADDDQDDKRKKDSALPPQVFILSSGELTPFTLIFRSPLSRQEYLLEAGVLGSVKITTEEVL